MSPKLLLELGRLIQYEAFPDSRAYASPPVVLSPEEIRESERLRVLGARIVYRARSEGGSCGEAAWS